MSADGIVFSDDKSKNRSLLTDGVQGISCIYVGPVEDAPTQDYKVWEQVYSLLQPGQFVSSVEVYANGAINAYVKQQGGKPALGFVRYRVDQ